MVLKFIHIVAFCYKAINLVYMEFANCGQLCFAEDAEGVRSARLTIEMTS